MISLSCGLPMNGKTLLCILFGGPSLRVSMGLMAQI